MPSLMIFFLFYVCFDTSYAGEIGLLAFAVEKNYSRGQKVGVAE